MDMQIVTVVRHTPHIDEMTRFYGEWLGMTVVESWARPDSRGAVLAPAGAAHGARIEILDMPGLTVADGVPDNVVLTVFVTDARAAHDELVERGVPIARGLEDTSWGHRSFGIDDPDGLRIWIVQDLGGH